jgi:hypothetical protein
MAKATPIPTRSRSMLAQRDRGRCVRCGGKGAHTHHRRPRGIRDEHTHHVGNLVTLCPLCHTWAHAHPEQAQAVGLIVSRHTPDPCFVQFRGIDGWVQPQCENTFTPHTEGHAS